MIKAKIYDGTIYSITGIPQQCLFDRGYFRDAARRYRFSVCWRLKLLLILLLTPIRLGPGRLLATLLCL